MAVPQDQGADEQAHGGNRPEGQVQQGGGPPGERGQTELPEQVVHQTQKPPGGQAEDQGVGLVGGGQTHHRNRRERKETGSSGSS